MTKLKICADAKSRLNVALTKFKKKINKSLTNSLSRSFSLTVISDLTADSETGSLIQANGQPAVCRAGLSY